MIAQLQELSESLVAIGIYEALYKGEALSYDSEVIESVARIYLHFDAILEGSHGEA